MDYKNVTASAELPGKKIIQNLGMVRGLTVRARKISMEQGLSLTFGDSNETEEEFITLYDEALEEAQDIMIKRAEKLGANAIVSVSYSASDFKFLCFGAAVVVE